MTETKTSGAKPRKRTRAPKDLCGCDLDMREHATEDHDLPPAHGGVEGDVDDRYAPDGLRDATDAPR